MEGAGWLDSEVSTKRGRKVRGAVERNEGQGFGGLEGRGGDGGGSRGGQRAAEEGAGTGESRRVIWPDPGSGAINAGVSRNERSGRQGDGSRGGRTGGKRTGGRGGAGGGMAAFAKKAGKKRKR